MRSMHIKNAGSLQIDLHYSVRTKRWRISIPVTYSMFMIIYIGFQADCASSRYLVIPYRIAELGQRLSTTDLSERKLILQEAKKCYETFLSQLSQYEMLSTTEKKLYAEYQDSPSTFSTISTTDPTARRNAKIANFALEKDLKKKLDVCICGLPEETIQNSLRESIVIRKYILIFTVSRPKSSLSTK